MQRLPRLTELMQLLDLGLLQLAELLGASVALLALLWQPPAMPMLPMFSNCLLAKSMLQFAPLLAGQLIGDCTISATCPRSIEVYASPPYPTLGR